MKSSDYDREEIRSALLDIAARHGGVLNQRDIVDAAKDPGHVLHAYFEWDDAACGEAYRLIQATQLVRRVKLSIVRSDGQTRELSIRTTRQFQSRPSMRSAVGGYEAIDAILSDDDKRRELLAQVLNELQAYRRRYAELSELQSVWVAVDEALESQPSSVSAPGTDESRLGAAGA